MVLRPGLEHRRDQRVEQGQRLIVRDLLLRLRGGEEREPEARGRRQIGHRDFPLRQGKDQRRRKPEIADLADVERRARRQRRSEEHTSELQSLMRISYAVFCLKKKKNNRRNQNK